MSDLRVYLLGAPSVERDGLAVTFDRRQAVALLAYLAMTGEPQSRDFLAALLWPEVGQRAARSALRRVLVSIRQRIGAEELQASREMVGLNDEHGWWVDARCFQEAVSACRSHRHQDDSLCSVCMERLAAAVALYRGDFLAGFGLRDSSTFDDWQSLQHSLLREQCLWALEQLSCAYAARGDLAAAIGYVQRWLGLDALQEKAHRLLMQLYAWTGQRSAAWRQYEACVQTLAEELGIAPEAATTELGEAIRQGGVPAPQSLFAPRGQTVASRPGAQLMEDLCMTVLAKPVDPAELGGLLSRLADTAAQMGEWERAEQLYLQALTLAQARGERRRAAWCFYFLAEMARAQCRYALSRQRYEASLAIWEELTDLAECFGVLVRMSDMLIWLGAYSEAEQVHRRCLAIAQQFEKSLWIAASLEGLGDVANRQGNSTEARRCFQESLSIGEEINQPRVIAWSLVGLAEADQVEGDLMQARERYQQSLNLCREHGIQDGIPIALIRLGRVACSLGEIAEAKKHFAEALAFEQGRGYTSAILEVLAGMAALLAMAGETAEALRLSLFILKQPMCWYETQCAVARLHNTLCATFPAQAATLAHDERPLTAVCERALVWLEAET